MYNRGVARGYEQLGRDTLLIGARWDRSLPERSQVSAAISILRVDAPHFPSRGMRSRLGSGLRAIEAFLLSRRIRNALDREIESGSVCAAEFAESSLEGYHSAGLLTIPHLIRCHTPLTLLRKYYSRSEFGYGKLAFALESEAIKRSPLLTTPSADLRARIIQIFGVKDSCVSVVPNPVESDVYRPIEIERSGCPVVLHVGRLDSRKGGTVLGRAAPVILDRVKDAQLVFAGQNRPGRRGAGVQSEILAPLTTDHQARVQFTGEILEDRLVREYSRAWVCVVPSMIYESFSYTAAQAMSCARPVVASRIGGIPEVVIDGSTGLLTSPGDHEELADKVTSLLGADRTRADYGKAGRARVVENFHPAVVARQNLLLLGLLS